MRQKVRHTEKNDPVPKTRKITESYTKDYHFLSLGTEEENKQYFRLFNDKDLGFTGTLADRIVESVRRECITAK